jgi:hypothetical protein
MWHFAEWVTCVTCVMWSATCIAAEPEQSDAASTLAKQRMDVMRQRAEALNIVGSEDEEIACSKEPLLRYNDTPRGIVTASLWALGAEGRPRAVLVLEVYGGTSMQYEFTCLTDPPKSAGTQGWRWAPRQADFSWLRIDDALSPHEAKKTRIRQLKQLTREFSASEEWRGQTHQLRLMPQPIHQYEDDAKGVLDGAIFVLAQGTNVEILMTVEARQDKDGTRHWEAGFSRLASASLNVTYRGKPFWSGPSSMSVGSSNAYYFRMAQLTPDERSVFAEK